MTPENFTLSFPVFIGVILSVGGTILGFVVKKWIADSEKAQDAKDREVHESFKLMGMKLDNESDKRELLKDELFATKLKMAELVGREEIITLTADLYGRFDKLRADVMGALNRKD